jgi:hypothetical protein
VAHHKQWRKTEPKLFDFPKVRATPLRQFAPAGFVYCFLPLIAKPD